MTGVLCSAASLMSHVALPGVHTFSLCVQQSALGIIMHAWMAAVALGYLAAFLEAFTSTERLQACSRWLVSARTGLRLFLLQGSSIRQQQQRQQLAGSFSEACLQSEVPRQPKEQARALLASQHTHDVCCPSSFIVAAGLSALSVGSTSSTVSGVGGTALGCGPCV